MRYIMSFFWAVLLMNMASYVLASMTGATYDAKFASIMGVAFAFIVMLIGQVIPPSKAETH